MKGKKTGHASGDLIISTPIGPSVILDLGLLDLGLLALGLLGPAVVVAHAHRHRLAEAREAPGLGVEREQGVYGLFLVGGLFRQSSSSVNHLRAKSMVNGNR